VAKKVDRKSQNPANLETQDQCNRSKVLFFSCFFKVKRKESSLGFSVTYKVTAKPILGFLQKD
jgi:hypothetical protein